MMNVSGLVSLIMIVLMGVFVVGIAAVVLRVRKRMRRMSQQVFGVSDLMEGLKQVEQEYSSVPKSVSAMTSLYLPRIQRDFPEFQYDEMKVRAENALTSYLLAIDSMNPAAFREEGEDLKDKIQMKIQMMRDSGQREHFRDIKLHRTEIANYVRREGRCIVTFQTALQYLYSSSVQPAESMVQKRFNVDLIYVQDRNLVRQEQDKSMGLNCPNCGAPLSGLGRKVCAYCGTPIVELNIYAWTFGNIQEVDS